MKDLTKQPPVLDRIRKRPRSWIPFDWEGMYHKVLKKKSKIVGFGYPAKKIQFIASGKSEVSAWKRNYLLCILAAEQPNL